MSSKSEPSTNAIAPDTTGMNFFSADQSLQDLLAIYLPPDLNAHVTPHLDRLGALAGGPLDLAARQADRYPPILHQRDRFGRDIQSIEYHPSYRDLEQAAFGDFGIHAQSHAPGILGWPKTYPATAKHAFTYLFNQAEFGLGCPINVTDGAAMLLSRFGDDALKAKYLAGPDHDRYGPPDPRRTVHDGEGGRIGRRLTDDDRQARRRPVPAPRRKMVLLECGRTCRDATGPTRRRRERNARPRPVPHAAFPPRRFAERLSHRPPQGQTRHALHGIGRDQARRRPRLCGRPARSRLRADGRDGQLVAPQQRREVDGVDAPRAARRSGRGARPDRIRQARISICRWHAGSC